jgi:hypothetical protein
MYVTLAVYPTGPVIPTESTTVTKDAIFSDYESIFYVNVTITSPYVAPNASVNTIAISPTLTTGVETFY